MKHNDDDRDDKVRIDKWLWAARFFKTRQLAAEAVDGGKVHINELRVKPAKAVNVGDVLHIRREQFEFIVTVLALSTRRGPAPEAAKLYRESEESRIAREALAAQLKIDHDALGDRKGRPTKRDRRHIVRFTES
ncbi:MAG: RNA-binding S4 domain-containing protein [Sulfuricella sp.]|nr:RNA-binding S4 domain-containing protein [Sulfuricella sp.]